MRPGVPRPAPCRRAFLLCLSGEPPRLLLQSGVRQAMEYLSESQWDRLRRYTDDG